MRRYLSWIEGLTTNQYVGGSNPSRRTTFSALAKPRLGLFVFFLECREGFEPERGQHAFRHVACRSALKARAGGATSRSEGADIPHGAPLAAFFMPRARGIFHALTREGFEPREGAATWQRYSSGRHAGLIAIYRSLRRRNRRRRVVRVRRQAAPGVPGRAGCSRR